MQLLSVLTDIFTTRGYEVMVSSPENNYLLLKKNTSTMAVGYSDPDQGASEGEAEMFVSMAENASADSMLFISPDKLRKGPRRILERAGCATWDRMALAIAIGEQFLVSDDRKKERKKKTEKFDQSAILDQFLNQDFDPLIRSLDEPAEAPAEENLIGENDNGIQVRKVEFPDQSTKPGAIKKTEQPAPEKKKETAASKVSEDVLLGAWAGFDDWKKKEETQIEDTEPVPVPDLPLMEPIEETPPEKKPWLGSILAPTRCTREEACAKAGVPNDTELVVEHVPNLLVSVSYSLKAEDGATVSREGEYLYDPIRSGLIDIPSALAEELRSTLSVWDGKGPAKGIDNIREDDKGYVRALKDRLTRERHAEDRMVRETIMSTIYQEVRYLFDPSSFNIRWSRRVVVPFWVKRDENGNINWMVDSYLGRFIQIK